MPNNWGLTQHELATVPPFLIRGLTKLGGLGSELPKVFGRVLMRDEYNSELYGPLQEEYLHGKEAGTHCLAVCRSTLSTFLCQDERLWDY